MILNFIKNFIIYKENRKLNENVLTHFSISIELYTKV